MVKRKTGSLYFYLNKRRINLSNPDVNLNFHFILPFFSEKEAKPESQVP